MIAPTALASVLLPYFAPLLLLAALAGPAWGRQWPRPPAWWQHQAACIRAHEGAWTSNTGNGYFGAYQFLQSTWENAGGRGLASDAAPREQTYRAWLVWKRDGGSWVEWGTRGMCGLT